MKDRILLWILFWGVLVAMVAWMLQILIIPAHAYQSDAAKSLDCTVIIGEMRHLLVGSQRRGAEEMYVTMNKESRKRWFHEFPFEPYDQYALNRKLEYLDMNISATEYAAFWDLIGCGRAPW